MDLPVSIQAYRGFGSARMVCVAGQVMMGPAARVRPRRHGRQGPGGWRRVLASARLAISTTVPRARVRILCAGAEQELVTDGHGYFSACLELPPGTPDALWRDYAIELVAPAPSEPVVEHGEVLGSTTASHRVIVSDIDDTVVRTGVSNKLVMLWRLFVHSASQRTPFPGIAALYRGLHEGADGTEQNPMIYVSRSPWSIYPTLEAFFRQHEIPLGPVLQLRDWGISLRHPFPRRARGHKREVVDRVLDAYDPLPVVLIGDSGQHDPELYLDVARRQPERVEAIYIRDLGHSHTRSAELTAMASELDTLGIDLVAAADTADMARHASRRGWISPDQLSSVTQTPTAEPRRAS